MSTKIQATAFTYSKENRLNYTRLSDTELERWVYSSPEDRKAAAEAGRRFPRFEDEIQELQDEIQELQDKIGAVVK